MYEVCWSSAAITLSYYTLHNTLAKHWVSPLGRRRIYLLLCLQVILKNLPPNSSLIDEIMERVKGFLVSKAFLKGDPSEASHPLRHIRGESVSTAMSTSSKAGSSSYLLIYIDSWFHFNSCLQIYLVTHNCPWFLDLLHLTLPNLFMNWNGSSHVNLHSISSASHFVLWQCVNIMEQLYYRNGELDQQCWLCANIYSWVLQFGCYGNRLIRWWLMWSGRENRRRRRRRQLLWVHLIAKRAREEDWYGDGA